MLLAPPLIENRLSRCSLLSEFVAVTKGRRLFHSNNDSALTSEPNFNVARQLERHQHPDVDFHLFSFCFNCSLDSVAFFSCYERVKLKKGKFAKIKGSKLGVMCVRLCMISL